MRRTTPHCPRCDYDLSGDVATWESQCPLKGTCPECGVRFDWREVLNPGLAEQAGFFEHQRGAAPIALLRTWMWTLLPWVFWKRVRLEGRVRPARAWLWLGMLVLALHAIASTIACTAHYFAIENQKLAMSNTMSGFRVTPVGHRLDSYIAMWTYPIVSIQDNGFGVAVTWHVLRAPEVSYALAAFFITYPVMLLVLPQSLGAAKVRWAQVQRALAYGLAWILALQLFRIGRNVAYLIESVLYTLEFSTVRSARWTPFPVMLYQWAVPAGVVLFTWICLWWLLCFTRGWRMRQGAVVWFLLTLAAALVAAIVTMRVHLLAIFG